MFNCYNLVEIMLISLLNKKLSQLKNVQDRWMKTFLTKCIYNRCKMRVNTKIVKQDI